MTSLAIGAQGQITLESDVLLHLGVRPGQRLEFDKLPGGEVRIRAGSSGTIDDFIGLLAGKTNKAMSIEEMNEIIASGWAGDQ